MQAELTHVKLGLALVLAGLLFGIALGVAFGINEDSFKDYIAAQVDAHPELHDDWSKEKIWRYAQRAHFHATGIAAFSLGLILLVAASSLKQKLKTMAALLVGLGSCYPLAWFTMYRLAPAIGRGPAHDHLLTELFTYVGVGGLIAGLFILMANLFLGLFRE
ncbi:MAG: hypothetical protein R3F42_05505 [Pseudomonadota bacterium]